ncbi:hypothetical protein WA026_015776 [Henosepilachna vigintioctopunctata]|uniref:Uncharacterized protein n=1 Tax=Henosepilachna vigintioctopunctata TaxID=420089 RepID=A0AAW1V201_9CUCU
MGSPIAPPFYRCWGVLDALTICPVCNSMGPLASLYYMGGCFRFPTAIPAHCSLLLALVVLILDESFGVGVCRMGSPPLEDGDLFDFRDLIKFAIGTCQDLVLIPLEE